MATRIVPDSALVVGGIHEDEETLYEAILGISHEHSYRPLRLVVTINHGESTISIWYASSLQPMSAEAWQKQAEARRLEATRRVSMARPSGKKTSLAGGSRRSGARTSFSQSLQGQMSFNATQTGRNRLLDSVTAEDAAGAAEASQPRLPELTSPEKAKAANRRTSSILARTELTTQGQADSANDRARRGQSFGPSGYDSRSFRASQRSTRTSFPSFATMDIDSHDDTLTMIDDNDTPPYIHGYEEHFLLNVLDPFESVTSEVLLSKVCCIPTSQLYRNQKSATLASDIDLEIKVVGILGSRAGQIIGLRNEDIFLFVHSRRMEVLSEITLRLQKISLRDSTEVILAPIINNTKVTSTQDILDAIVVTDYEISHLVVLEARTHTLHFYAKNMNASPQHMLRLEEIAFSPVLAPDELKLDAIIPNSTPAVLPKASLMSLANPQPLGCFNVTDTIGMVHRGQLKLCPRNGYARKILEHCWSVLPSIGESIYNTWWSCLHGSCKSSSMAEWESLVISLLQPFMQHLPQSNDVDPDDNATNSANPLYAGSIRIKGNVWEGLSKSVASAESGIIQSSDGDIFIKNCVFKARQYSQKTRSRSTVSNAVSIDTLAKLVLALHLLLEEETLDILSPETLYSKNGFGLKDTVAQMVYYLGWKDWIKAYQVMDVPHGPGMSKVVFETVSFELNSLQPFMKPPSIVHWVEQAGKGNIMSFPTLSDLHNIRLNRGQVDNVLEDQHVIRAIASRFTPRTYAMLTMMGNAEGSSGLLDVTACNGINCQILDTLPESVSLVLRSFLANHRAGAGTRWPKTALKLLDRRDILKIKEEPMTHSNIAQAEELGGLSGLSPTELCERVRSSQPFAEPEPNTTLGLMYRSDTAFDEARKLLRSQLHPVAVIHSPQGKSEAQFLEMEKAYAQLVGIRSTAVTTGSALLDFRHFSPLPTQEMEIFLWETQVRMSPSGHVMGLSKENFTEAKSAWASYHTGVAAGLKIWPGIDSIDTSWILLNKPHDPNNRHAGLLLGLGLNGYLARLEKWLVFKYLTPKHDMTSISLLLGLAASYMGTMNSLVVRVLSVHLVSLLPYGSAELNLSPLVQTAGTMGVGLLYYNSQHRRMSEVMLSEVEYEDHPDEMSGPFIRGEGYRLAAGFALGFINLGHGNDLRALHDMGVERRLLSWITGSREPNTVDVVDQATAGALVAIALIFMKSNNKALARKVDVPPRRPQFGSIRPDHMLLRVVARSLIMWSEIEATDEWIYQNLPVQIQEEIAEWAFMTETTLSDLPALAVSHVVAPLNSDHIYLYNIVVGLCWSISFKYAGSGNSNAGNLILTYYDHISHFLLKPSTFDEKLVRSALGRLQHLLLLSAATVMAGTGDLEVFRRARILHGTVDQFSTFGLHQAAHMVIGVLFLGQGRMTFSNSNLAIASLLCAFYPLYPKEVMDNNEHLQAFRHFWVFATEPRCLFPRDVDTDKPVITAVEVTFKDGTTKIVEAPALLLPSLDAIAQVRTLSQEYWPVALDFVRNPDHLADFRKHQTIFLKRRSQVDQYGGNTYELALARERDARRTAVTNPDRAPNSTGDDFVDETFALSVFGDLKLTHADLESIFPRPLGDAAPMRRKKNFPAAAKGTVGAETEEDEEEERAEAVHGIMGLPLRTLLDSRTTRVDDLLIAERDVDAGND